MCAMLADGVLVVGPNAGHAFSFVRDEALALREVGVDATGSQFRSRDFFPQLLARIVGGDEACLGDRLAPEAVAELPARRVVYVDGYGNLKTSWFSAPAASGDRIEVTIGGQSAVATVSDGTFEVPVGEMAFAPGSSGWATRSGGEARRVAGGRHRGGSHSRRVTSGAQIPCPPTLASSEALSSRAFPEALLDDQDGSNPGAEITSSSVRSG